MTTRFQEKGKRPAAPTFDPKENRTHSSLRTRSIREMMSAYQRSGDLVPISASLAMYGDFSEIGDFRQAMDRINAGKTAFMQLPAEVRSMVDNDPHKYIEWINDPENVAKAIELKLLDPPDAPPRPQTVTLVDPEGLPVESPVQGGE